MRRDKAARAGEAGQTQPVHAEASTGDKVQSNLQAIRATSDTLDYDDARRGDSLYGSCSGSKAGYDRKAPEMTVHFRDKDVTEIAASGGVKVTREDQTGNGDRALYDAATDVVTLTGKPAQVLDRERGWSKGPTVTMRKKEKSVLIQGGRGERTTTQHPVKK